MAKVNLTDKYSAQVNNIVNKSTPKTVNPYNQQPLTQVTDTVKPLSEIKPDFKPLGEQIRNTPTQASYLGETSLQALKGVGRTIASIPSAITVASSIKSEQPKSVTIAGTEISTETKPYQAYDYTTEYKSIKDSLETQYGSYANMPKNTKAIYENVVNSSLTMDNFGKSFEEQKANIEQAYAGRDIPQFVQDKYNKVVDQEAEFNARIDNAKQKLVQLAQTNVKEITAIQQEYADKDILPITEYAGKVASTIIQMSPYIAASIGGGFAGGALASNVLGSSALYATVYTNSLGTALSEGATTEQANTYAHVSALIEAGTELLFGGIPGATKGVLSTGVNGLLEKALVKESMSGSLQKLITKSIDVFGEGSEPTTIGLEWFKEAHKIIHKYYDNITFSIQTNGTLLTEEWVRFFIDEDVKVGVSFDGLSQAKQRGFEDKTLYGLWLLISNNLYPGVISVISDDNYDKLLENYLYMKSLGIRSIAFNKVFDSSRSIGIESEQIEGYLKSFSDLFDYWLQDETGLYIEQFNGFLKGVLQSGKFICSLSGNCRNNLIGFNQLGQIEPCDRYFTSLYRTPLTIHEYDSLEQATLTEEYTHLTTQQEIRKNTFCKDCEIFDYCNGGCPADALFFNDGLGHNPNVCYVRKREWFIIFNKIKDIDPSTIKNKGAASILLFNRSLSFIDEVRRDLHGEL
jgi:uncharacterized protein